MLPLTSTYGSWLTRRRAVMRDLREREPLLLERLLLVFGDEHKAMSWMSRPSVALGCSPWALLNAEGSTGIMDELVRIEYGDLS